MLRPVALALIAGFLLLLAFTGSLAGGAVLQGTSTTVLYLPLVLRNFFVPTPTPVPTPTLTRTLFPTSTPFRTWTPGPTRTATRRIPSPTPIPTATNTLIPSRTPTSTATATNTATTTFMPLPAITIEFPTATSTSTARPSPTQAETVLPPGEAGGPGLGLFSGDNQLRLALLVSLGLLWVLLGGWIYLLWRRWRY
jgi:hypothetical protein